MPPSAADKRLSAEITPHKVGTRTDSAAQLAWFLETVWRMDPAEVEDAICDGFSDKGIDALIVNSDLAEIVVIQGKWIVDPSKKTVGDGALKQLVGAADYFKSPETVQGLLDSSPNAELKMLLIRQDVKAVVAAGGHTMRLVFVTNGDLDASATSYINARGSVPPGIEVWDRPKMTSVAARTERAELRPETVSLAAAAKPSVMQLDSGQQIAVAIVPASQLVKLPGIDDHTLFSRNVRLFLGKSKINEGLRETVEDPSQHTLFPAYHNGLTILTSGFTVRGKRLTLDKVGVVNGCQSLSTLYEGKPSITDNLQLVVKIVEVHSNNDLSDLITFRSNNQNAVTMRDQRSNDRVMRDLKASVTAEYGAAFGLSIRAGESSSTKDTLDNAFAAQLITAVYLKEPWAAVRKVRLFDQDYRKIFNRTITAHSLRLLFLLDQAVVAARKELRPDLRSSFASVRFTLVHLVAQVCAISESGQRLISDPGAFLPHSEAAVLKSLRTIAEEVVNSVNFFIESEIADRAEQVKSEPDLDLPDFDPKTVFKAMKGVKDLENETLRNARRDAKRSSYLFTVTPGVAKKDQSKTVAKKAVAKKAPAKKA